MGSPVSAVIANLVMEEVEEKAITTAPTAPVWWYQKFHAHLNSINPHIQFTLVTEDHNSLAFLDTQKTRVNEHIVVDVYRKPTQLRPVPRFPFPSSTAAQEVSC